MPSDASSFGWDRLQIPYFVPVCRRVLDDYMAAAGLRFRDSQPWSVRYGRGRRCWFQIHYMVEDAPRYSPMLSIGLRPRWWSARKLDSIGLWYAIPAEDVAHAYPLKYFSSEAELLEIVAYLRDNVIDRYARPLWQDTCTLADLLRKREGELSD
jgi:hypothetical protein